MTRTPDCRIVDDDGVVLYEAGSFDEARVQCYRLLLLGVYDRLSIADPKGERGETFVTRTDAHRWWRREREKKQVAKLRAAAEQAARDGFCTVRRQRAERAANGLSGLMTMAIVALTFDALMRIFG